MVPKWYVLDIFNTTISTTTNSITSRNRGFESFGWNIFFSINHFSLDKVQNCIWFKGASFIWVQKSHLTAQTSSRSQRWWCRTRPATSTAASSSASTPTTSLPSTCRHLWRLLFTKKFLLQKCPYQTMKSWSCIKVIKKQSCFLISKCSINLIFGSMRNNETALAIF